MERVIPEKMSQSAYEVSALKFRPGTFSQLVGQPHIVRTLSNAIKAGRIAHSYIFSGTRGVGKTTTARILAKALNCAEGPTPDPCMKCDNCIDITRGASLDVLEIDGASNTGVDNIRELRENVRFSPSSSRYKIYIIDEVHQISKAAFNALLKTLEEPPPHVVFIFATTELNKVPETILSRCQSFEYRTISTVDIACQLKMMAETLEIETTESAIGLLARRARGSMRDAQSLFDQTAAFGGGKVTAEDVKLILGMVDKSLLFEIMDALVKMDGVSVLEGIEKMVSTGGDPALFTEELCETARNIVAVKLRPDSNSELEVDERTKIAKWAGQLSEEEIQRFFDTFIEVAEQMRRSHQPSMNLEMGLLRLTQRRGLVTVGSLIDEVAKATTMIEKEFIPPGESAPPPLLQSAIQKQVEPVSPRPTPEPEPEIPFSIVEAETKNAPADLVRKFKSVKPSLQGVFENATIHIIEDAVVVTVSNEYELSRLTEKETNVAVEEIACQAFGKKTRLVVKLAGDQKKKGDDAERLKSDEKDSAILGQMAEMPIVQDALELFNGDIVEAKVTKK